MPRILSSEWFFFWAISVVLLVIAGGVGLSFLEHRDNLQQQPASPEVAAAYPGSGNEIESARSDGLPRDVHPDVSTAVVNRVVSVPTPQQPPVAINTEPASEVSVAKVTVGTDESTNGPASAAVQSEDPPLPVSEPAAQPKTDSAAQIKLGKKLFLHRWQPHDKLARGGDGLGPLFNGESCAECHSQGGVGGAGSNEHSVHAFEILPSKAGEEVRSGVIHAFATKPHEAENLEALDRHFRPGKVVAGLARSGSKELTSKVDIDATRLVWINSPALWGLGRIDQLTVDQLKRADPKVPTSETRRAGTSGRFRIHPDGRIGKFGWKGQFASLKDFVAGACANEIGLSNEYASQFVPGEFRPDPEARHDLSADQVDAMVQFVASLPEPKQVMPNDPTHRALVKKGEELTTRIGCADCHTRNIGDVQNVYSDYRMHRVEDTLRVSDAYYHQDFKLEVEPPRYYPQLSEWRTPALWGVADTAPYWHDGGAQTLEAAILRHAAEGQSAVNAYRKLDREDQQSVLSFLNTLRAPSKHELAAAKVALSDAQ